MFSASTVHSTQPLAPAGCGHHAWPSESTGAPEVHSAALRRILLSSNASPRPSYRRIGANYGMRTFADLFTPRQLVALTTFSELVAEARQKVLADGGSEAYANAVATYSALAVDRSADFWCTIATWSPQPKNELVAHAFTRQAIPMAWDFGEVNPFSDSGGSFESNLSYVAKAISTPGGAPPHGEAKQLDATAAVSGVQRPLVCTDPPYYDNIGYADLADFFYIWLRRSLRDIHPDLFRTVLTPKVEELVATPYRFEGDTEKAQQFFEDGLRKAFVRMREVHHPQYPLTLFYAFKQAESEEEADENGAGGSVVTSTGWETMLQGLLDTEFQITGTWPVCSERGARSIAIGTNALASSIVLACRPRPADAPKASRADFVRALRRELPDALRRLQHGNIAPVDFAQAAIGPGMAVFSRYAAVLEADGRPMRVRTALGLINQVLDEVLAEQEAEFDAETRWALAWFEQHGHADGQFGDAETLSKAKDVSVTGLEAAGILKARAGKVRLLRRDELDPDWDPAADRRLTVWEITQHLIRALASSEADAAGLLRRVGALGEAARDLAYRLYTICERKGWAEEARDYNTLVVVWPQITRQAPEAEQMRLG